MGDGDTLRALQLTGAGVGTVAEAKFVHLRQQGERTDASRNEQHRRAVLTGCNTSTAANTGSCIHTLLSLIVRNKDIVGILGRSGTHGDKTTGLENLVEGGTIHHKVLDYREGGTPPRLYRNGRPVLKVTHKQLTCSNMVIRSVSTTVYIERTCSAYTLSAIVVEGYRTTALAASLYCNRVAAFTNQLLVQNIEHLKERRIFFDTRNMIGLEMSFCLGVLLTPNL